MPLLSTLGASSARALGGGGGESLITLGEGELVVQASAGTYEWTVPDDVYFISALAIGSGGSGGYGSRNTNYQYVGEPIYYGVTGGGGGAGGLSYRNGVRVVPGETLTIYAGTGAVATTDSTSASGETSYIARGATTLVHATGGFGGGRTGSAGAGGSGGVTLGYTGGGDGGNGGSGGYTGTQQFDYDPRDGQGGGGAGGYSGDGGDNGALGSGGSAASGGDQSINGGGGGGVGIYGEGDSGSTLSAGGSGGDDGISINTTGQRNSGGDYGGGGGSRTGSSPGYGGNGGDGVVRILWGTGRSFPSTSVTEEDSNSNVTTIS